MQSFANKAVFFQATNGGQKKDKSLFLDPNKKLKLRMARGLEKDVPGSEKREAAPLSQLGPRKTGLSLQLALLPDPLACLLHVVHWAHQTCRCPAKASGLLWHNNGHSGQPNHTQMKLLLHARGAAAHRAQKSDEISGRRPTDADSPFRAGVPEPSVAKLGSTTSIAEAASEQGQGVEATLRTQEPTSRPVVLLLVAVSFLVLQEVLVAPDVGELGAR